MKQLLLALLLVILPVAFPVSGVLGQLTTEQTVTLRMTGQQFLPNGTGLAYFSDGSISEFEHEMTPQEGWYYDNTTTIFYTGEIPGISTANNTKCSGGYSDFNKNSTMTSINTNTTQHTLTIINGADIIENKSKAIQPNPIIRIKAGDTVTWINEDRTTHILTSPPGEFSFFSQIQAGQTFEVTLSSTESTIEEDRRVSCTFTEPGGFHYDVDLSNNGIRGLVIVEE